MVKYFCDKCKKECDEKYIELKITPDLHHNSEIDVEYKGLKTNDSSRIKRLCPVCFDGFNRFLKYHVVLWGDFIKST